MAHTTKDNPDKYYRKAKEDGYRARSAYKLVQIFQAYGIFYPVVDAETTKRILLNARCQYCSEEHANREGTCSDKSTEGVEEYSCLSLGRIRNIVDLCAAPGSWSQCIRDFVYYDYNIFKESFDLIFKSVTPCEKLREYCNTEPTMIAVDLQDMAPIRGVECLTGDITDYEVLKRIKDSLVGRATGHAAEMNDSEFAVHNTGLAQLVTCDGAPYITGLHEIDAFMQSDLIRSALLLCCSILEANGTFVCKTFDDSVESPFYRQISIFFEDFSIFKPAASRTSSAEHFIVASGFKPFGKLPKTIGSGREEASYYEDPKEIGETTWLFPLMSCGDLSGYDRVLNRQ